MIDLLLEQDYAVDHAMIAASVAVPESQIETFFTLHPMAITMANDGARLPVQP
jgi:hypothetical protein